MFLDKNRARRDGEARKESISIKSGHDWPIRQWYGIHFQRGCTWHLSKSDTSWQINMDHLTSTSFFTRTWYSPGRRHVGFLRGPPLRMRRGKAWTLRHSSTLLASSVPHSAPATAAILTNTSRNSPRDIRHKCVLLYFPSLSMEEHSNHIHIHLIYFATHKTQT